MAKRKRKYRAVHTVHWGCYRFEAGQEFTTADLKPPTDDAALEPLPERELQDWLEGGRVVEVKPKRKPRKKKASPPTEIDVPAHPNWRKENLSP